jgi:hypothetical protein
MEPETCKYFFHQPADFTSIDLSLLQAIDMLRGPDDLPRPLEVQYTVDRKTNTFVIDNRSADGESLNSTFIMFLEWTIGYDAFDVHWLIGDLRVSN